MLVAALVLVQCWTVTAAEEPAPPGRETENQPPVVTVDIPLQSLPEDNPGNEGYRLVNLSIYFDDDGGVENLIYNIACETNRSHIDGWVDGHFLSFATPTKDWYGQEMFRARATDGEGLWTESNNFTVRVDPVIEPLRFLPLPEIDVDAQSEWFFDLDKYIVDMEYGFEGLHLATNSSFFRVDGLRLFINYTVYYVEVPFLDPVLLNASNPSSKAEAVLTVRVWPRGHFWNPFEQPRQIVMTQDQNYSLDLSTAVMCNETPLPKLTWSTLAGTNGSSPLLNFSVQNKTTIILTPSRHRSGNGTITLTASDGKVRTRTFTLPVHIVPVFSPDRIVMVRTMTVNQSESTGFNLTVDGPNDDLTFWTNSTLFSVDKNGRTYYRFGKPGQDDVGKWHIGFCVTWVHDASVVLRWNLSLTVVNVNDPPDIALIIEPGHGKRVRGQMLTFECIARDIDSDHLNVTWYSDGIAFANGSTVHYSGLAPGVHQIHVNVSDGEYSITSRAITLTVLPELPTENVERLDYALIVGILAMLCLLAVAMGAALSRANKKP